MQTEYLTIKQLSVYANLHKNTLKLWMKRGMPFFRIGRSVRFKRSEFDSWMEAFRAEGTEKQRLQVFKEEALREVLK